MTSSVFYQPKQVKRHWKKWIPVFYVYSLAHSQAKKIFLCRIEVYDLPIIVIIGTILFLIL
ncbi:MAG: hypothetical protein LBK82_14725 [Planctomycetaceae bacterium]|nr:hypothetical protein [Planctomycetaceae bacterium]